MCNSNKCSICECGEEEIPVFWRGKESKQADMFGHSLLSTTKECPKDVSEEWCSNDENDPQAIYVDLEKNVETYTAYEGQEIWGAIYSENCMIDNLQKIDV